MPRLDLDPAPRPELDSLIAEAIRADGQPPFSDQSLVDLASGERMPLLALDDDEVVGAAVLTRAGDPREAEVVVRPSARHRGVGRALLARVLDESAGRVLVWAHGDHPDARALAESLGLRPVRELLQLRLSPVAGGVRSDGIEPFRPGLDDAEWLEVNARAFAGHPEQGRLTQRDLDARLGEEWFEPEDFLLARGSAGELIGFCWLKVQGGIGEFYAVGVDPVAQGTGLGRRLVNAGLERLERRGIRTSSLYVEADNVAAVRLYRSVGFTDHTIDVQYSSS